METERRPRLTPAIADVRRAVREMLAPFAAAAPGSLVLVGLSGGPDSLALAQATAFEASRLGLLAGAVIIDHALQAGSADVAARAAAEATGFGLDPVQIRRVTVGRAGAGSDGGPEAAARAARYEAFASVLTETGATRILLGHTLDDQAETVLLGLARGSGPGSLKGMDAETGLYLRPLLGVRRAVTHQFCVDSGLTAWSDPHNDDRTFARVRVRTDILPAMEREIGPGIAEALARTADQLREDAEALDQMVLEMVEEIVEPAEAGIAVGVATLAVNPAALRHRLVRYIVHSEFGVSLSRAHTLAVAALVTDWHGQKPLDLPGVRVKRNGGLIVFQAADAAGTSPDQQPTNEGTISHA